MKESPILFNAEMVKAILSGRKTQTRRICSEVEPSSFPACLSNRQWAKVNKALPMAFGPDYFCPLGQPGDQLWVREAIFPAPLEMQSAPPRETLWNIAYRDGQQLEKLAPAAYNPTLYNYERWTPSIHMPRWASRIDLLITGVRVERLNAISDSDAIAEGLERYNDDGIVYYGQYGRGDCRPEVAYGDLWQSIYGSESWQANPWVWVIEFERVAPAGERS